MRSKCATPVPRRTWLSDTGPHGRGKKGRPGIYSRLNRAEGPIGEQYREWGFRSRQLGRIVSGCASREEALTRQAEDQQRHFAGKPAPLAASQIPTVRELADEVREVKRRRMKSLTFTEWERRLDRILLPHFGRAKVTEVTPVHVADFVRGLAADGRAASTIQSYLIPLHAVFKHAAFKSLIASNPVEVANRNDDARPSSVATKQPRTPFEWSREALHSILETSKTLDDRSEARARYYPVIATLAYTGLRIGEALALRWQDVDLSANTLTVSGTWSRRRERTTTKTVASERTITIPNALVSILAEHSLRAFEKGQTDPNHYVFANRDGSEPLAYWNVRVRGWATVTEQLGLKGQVRLHDLRHGAASILIDAGLTPVEVADHLGHKDAGVTMRTYAGMFDRAKAATRAAEAFDALAAGPASSGGPR